jgi:hypothetical protein
MKLTQNLVTSCSTLTAPALTALALAALLLAACNGDNKDNAVDAMSMAGSATLSLQPAAIPNARGPGNPPALGDRIDRAGRPAITAALIGTFEADPDVKAKLVADYNKAGLLNQSFAATMKTSLGILDGLDGVCGNQLLATVGDDRYAALTQVLLDDQLYVNSDSSGSVYLGVEAEFISAVPAGAGAGGGRQPGDDVIERSYSVLAAGALKGIDDGVPRDDTVPSPNNFPFLAPPP